MVQCFLLGLLLRVLGCLLRAVVDVFYICWLSQDYLPTLFVLPLTLQTKIHPLFCHLIEAEIIFPKSEDRNNLCAGHTQRHQALLM